ncbi:MAG: hypothetical protein J5994_08810 [Ruminococcus sp.]|nr:hypothetical protein [Ruminococcus sp.]
MIKFQNDCVGCPDGVPCMGLSCPYRHVPHFYCDECGEEASHAYDYDGDLLCGECLRSQLVGIFSEMTVGEMVKALCAVYSDVEVNEYGCS